MISESPAPTGTDGRRSAFIDCVRGYAILLVITSHLTYSYPNLPYPVHRFTVLGWHGVQLFFLGSAVTLMMSWQNEMLRHGSTDVAAFFLRRFFRIAPAYYSAALFYAFFWPPAVGFRAGQAVAWLLFLNAWHPALSRPSLGGWQVVPGGWSISAEFAFYAAFPFIAARITTLRKATGFFLGVTIGACVLNSVAQGWMVAMYDHESIEGFMYFFVPNQAPVFALGILLFFILESLGSERLRTARRYLKPCTGLIICAAGMLFLSISYLEPPRWFSLDIHAPPALLQASLAFMLFVIALAAGRPGGFVNQPLAFVGKVSFSAYLIHFAVIDGIIQSFPSLSGIGATGYWAILAFCLGWLAVVVMTIAASACSYRFIEEPGMGLGRWMIAAQRRRAVVARPD